MVASENYLWNIAMHIFLLYNYQVAELRVFIFPLLKALF